MVSLDDSRQRGNWCDKPIDITQIHLPGYIFLGSKITGDSDCSLEIKRCFPLGRKAMTNLDSILKSRDIILPTKVYIVKTIVFPVVVYGCELDHKEELMLLNCGAGEDTWESPGLMETKPVNPKRNQSLERLMLKLKRQLATWYEEVTLWKRPWCWERFKAKGGRGWQRIRWFESIINSKELNLSKLGGKVEDREAWHAAVHGVTKSQTWFSDWTITTSPRSLL